MSQVGLEQFVFFERVDDLEVNVKRQVPLMQFLFISELNKKVLKEILVRRLLMFRLIFSARVPPPVRFYHAKVQEHSNGVNIMDLAQFWQVEFLLSAVGLVDDELVQS
jgi:hypothetical protein